MNTPPPDEPPVSKYIHGYHRREYRTLQSPRLPHLKIKDATYFVTFRLADSMPQNVLRRFQEELARHENQLAAGTSLPPDERKQKLHRERFRLMEHWLDQGLGSCVLRRPEIAELTVSVLRFFHGDRYELQTWCVMPNHIHVLVKPLGEHELGSIVKSWKQYISRRAKPLAGWPEKQFWQIESYDHWVRDLAERERITGYILQNPVKAGLCAAPENWPWSSIFQPGGVAQVSKPAGHLARAQE